jgi:MraZ protein
VRTTVLFGEYDLTIDEKNRLLVPAEVRRSLDPEADGGAFFVTVGKNRKPWLYPERRYEALVSKLESQLTPADDELAFDQMVFSMASREEWDSQGRLLLKEKYRTRTGLAREITMIGVRDHLEIWNRDDWAKRRDELEGQRAEISARQRQQMIAADGSSNGSPGKPL